MCRPIELNNLLGGGSGNTLAPLSGGFDSDAVGLPPLAKFRPNSTTASDSMLMFPLKPNYGSNGNLRMGSESEEEIDIGSFDDLLDYTLPKDAPLMVEEEEEDKLLMSFMTSEEEEQQGAMKEVLEQEDCLTELEQLMDGGEEFDKTEISILYSFLNESEPICQKQQQPFEVLKQEEEELLNPFYQHQQYHQQHQKQYRNEDEEDSFVNLLDLPNVKGDGFDPPEATMPHFKTPIPPPLVKIPSSTTLTESTSTKSRRLCKQEGCVKRSRSSGLCIAHGGGRRCDVEGCDRSSQGGNLCIRHGGGKRCTEIGCGRAAQSNMKCKAHGGGPRCQFEGCDRSSQGGGFCRSHGGGKRCQHSGCSKGTQRGDFCAVHGGSRLCGIEGCERNDRGGGFCATHGGGKRCSVQDCQKPCRRKGKCSAHLRSSKD